MKKSKQPMVTSTVQMTPEHSEMLNEMRRGVKGFTLRALVALTIEKKYAKFKSMKAADEATQPADIEEVWKGITEFAKGMHPKGSITEELDAVVAAKEAAAK